MILTVTPGIGVLVPSNTTPLMRVSSGLPGMNPEAVKIAGSPVTPVKVALTTLLLIPSWGPEGQDGGRPPIAIRVSNDRRLAIKTSPSLEYLEGGLHTF